MKLLSLSGSKTYLVVYVGLSPQSSLSSCLLLCPALTHQSGSEAAPVPSPTSQSPSSSTLTLLEKSLLFPKKERLWDGRWIADFVLESYIWFNEGCLEEFYQEAEGDIVHFTSSLSREICHIGKKYSVHLNHFPLFSIIVPFHALLVFLGPSVLGFRRIRNDSLHVSKLSLRLRICSILTLLLISYLLIKAYNKVFLSS